MRWSPLLLVAVLHVFVPLGTACQTRPIPISAQQGSTITIPLETITSTVGYGSTDGSVPDVQRGALRWTLDAPWPSGTDLATRFTTVLVAPPSASSWDASLSRHALLSVIDVPLDAPLGTHSLHVVNQDGSPVEHPTMGGYHGQVRILPSSVPIPGDDPIDGEPSVGLDALFQTSMPQPSARLVFSQPVWSAELSVGFDPALLEVTGAVAGDGNRTGAWVRPAAPDRVEIGVVGFERAVANVAILFRPVGAAIDLTTDPDAIEVFSSRFTDASGAAISVAVSIAGIE